MEFLFALFMMEVVSGSKPEASSLTPPFPAEAVFVIIGHEPAPIVPPILSPSKQQNRESLFSKSSHGGEETGTSVLLLPSRIIPSIAGGNIVLCKNEGSLSADRGEGSRLGGDPNEVWDSLEPGISVPERINPSPFGKVRGKCHPDTMLTVSGGIYFHIIFCSGCN